MDGLKIRTRYASHAGSNVGAIVATASGRRMRVRRDQALDFEDQAELVAAELAERQGWHLTGAREALEGGGYVFTAEPGVTRPCLECGRLIGYPVPIGDGAPGVAWVCDGHPPMVRRQHRSAGGVQ